MTSGQWTMGAIRKVRVWRPVVRVSPSFTTTVRLEMSQSKNWPIMGTVLALATIWTLGQRRSRSPRVAQWSGSMWFTTT